MLGGERPLAATAASRRVYAAFHSDDPTHALMHGPTYSGHALACAAANASLDVLQPAFLRAAFALLAITSMSCFLPFFAISSPFSFEEPKMGP